MINIQQLIMQLAIIIAIGWLLSQVISWILPSMDISDASQPSQCQLDTCDCD
jgi:hypothetical protein